MVSEYNCAAKRNFQVIKVRPIRITIIHICDTRVFWFNLYTVIQSIALFVSKQLLLD